ncbi:MAG TPA: hypothetical protein VGL75_18555 [Acidothermaceae bacterium]
MGNGLAEVGFLAVLTVIVLPCAFFTLLALLDRFERNLDPGAQTPPTPVVKPEPVLAVETAAEGTMETAELDYESAGGDVVSLPLPVTVVEAPAAATG